MGMSIPPVLLPSAGSQIIFVCDCVVAWWLIVRLAPPVPEDDPEWGWGGMFN
jgi:hypothetical protein